MKKKSFFNKTILKKVFIYLGPAILILGFVFLGSIDKGSTSSSSLSMASLASNNFGNISTDQLSEFYLVAQVADSVNLNSAEVVASNYVIVSVMQKSGQSSTSKLEKPTYTDTSGFDRGIVTYVVAEGETADSIAAKYGISVDQLRWSNGLKTDDLSVGQSLSLPSVPGIVYTVKEDDSISSIAEKTGSSSSEIATVNDLEVSANISTGQKLVIPGGTLPATERPEYVAPSSYITYYSFSGSTSDRLNLRTIATGFYVASPGNPGVAGQCTWYAWYMRANDSRSLGQLPGGLGNANSWVYQLSSSFDIDRTPEAGAVFQTPAGWYGHVGYVMAVNNDGSITVREMNYNNLAYTIVESEIPANLVANYYYIH